MAVRIAFAFLLASLSATVAVAQASTTATSAQSAGQKACSLLAAAFPQGQVSLPGSNQYAADIAHWTISSQQNSTCSIEPSSPQDVATILNIVGRSDIRSPFAVKGGGHAYNLGFSSTVGVQISMAKFNSVAFDSVSNLVTVGTGLDWDEVYAYLEPLGLTVAGARAPPVGVSGFSLGGGYSWKTNQVGLTIDTIQGYDIVLPNGTFTSVTNATNPDLFFALKGGYNNFGVVTAIKYTALPQTQVFAGSLVFSPDVASQFNAAIEAFNFNNTDPKAQILGLYRYTGGQLLAVAVLYYDAPSAPAGLFDGFLSIPALLNDVKTRPFREFIATTLGDPLAPYHPFKSAQHVVPIVKYTAGIMDVMRQQVLSVGTALSAQFNGSAILVWFTAEPFTNAFDHSLGGAYPHPPSRQVTPGTPLIAVQNPSSAQEAFLVAQIKQMSAAVQTQAVLEGQSRWSDLLYPNYALGDTPVWRMYGSNVNRLNTIAKAVDPRKVMQLTGGFKFGL